MATTQRLGIDIVGTDKTRAAFMSAQRSMGAFTKTIAFATGALAGIAGGALLKNVVQSFIQINKHVEPVKTSFQQIDRAWQDFALHVGSGGLNDALVRFNTTIGQMIVGTKGLSVSLGKFLGSAVDVVSVALQGFGRTVGFVYDNIEIFKKSLMGIAFYVVITQVIALGRSFILAVAAIRAAGIATTLFALAQRRALLLGVIAVAVTAKLTGTFDKLAEVINKAIKMGEDLIPIIGDDLIAGLNGLGVETKSLTVGFDEFDGKLKHLPKTFKEIEDAIKKGAPALEKYRKGMVDIKQFVIGLQDEGAALGKTDGALARLAASQKFYNKMQDEGITLIRGQKEAAEQWLNKIPEAVNALARQKSALQTAIDIGEAFKSTFSSAFASIVDGTSSVTMAIKSMVSSLLASLTNLFANKAFAMLIEGGPGSNGTGGLVGALFKGLGGMLGGFKGLATAAALPSATFGGPKAAGGPVSAGKHYLVGERGPELFAPGTSGSIIPNRSAGAVNVKVNIINQAGVDVQQRQSPGGRGLDVLITNKVNEVIGSGKADTTMRGRYGAAPQKVRR